MLRIVLATLIATIVPLLTFGDTRGLKPINIVDSSGKQIELYRRSYALVIGISDYTAGWPDLPSVTDETLDIQRALVSNGFVVTRILNPNKRELKSAPFMLHIFFSKTVAPPSLSAANFSRVLTLQIPHENILPAPAKPREGILENSEEA